MRPDQKHPLRFKRRKVMPDRKISNFDFKKILGLTVEEIDELLANKESFIKSFEIPKHDGTKRTIIAPTGRLKFLQKMIYFKLLKKYRYHDAVHGFVPKRGIATNAAQHVGAKSLGKIDIKKFFDSITTDHLRNCLFGNKNICRYCKNYERMMDGKCHPSLYKNKTEKFDYRCEEIKAVFFPDYCEKTGYQSLFLRVMEASTYNGTTAQGFPTSPMLANIVMRGFDKAMSEYCQPLRITYTRYADDLTFSSKELSSKELMDSVKQHAYRLLWAFKFAPKREKTRFRSSGTRLKTCGVVVNVKTNIERRELMIFRAKVHHAINKFPDRTTKSRIRTLKGFASFVMSINEDMGKKYMDKLIEFEKQKFQEHQ
jgi:RNA-directed DNA polymerase